MQESTNPLKSITPKIQTAVNTPMDRAEFLKLIGVGLLSAVGASAIVRGLQLGQRPSSHSAQGYGNSAYGR